MTLHLTRPAAKTTQYLQPGAPWHDLPPLDLLASGPALVDGATGARHSAAAVNAQVGAVAAGLLEAGVRPGDVVTWQLPNSPVVVSALPGVLADRGRGGSCPSPSGRGRDGRRPPQVDPRIHINTLGRCRPAGSRRTDHRSRPGDIDVDPSSVAVVQFTAGSTGRPKAVIHTHRTLGYKARSMVGVHGLRPSDVVLMPAPMAHVSGLLNGVLVPAAAGMTTVTMATWDPGRAL